MRYALDTSASVHCHDGRPKASTSTAGSPKRLHTAQRRLATRSYCSHIKSSQNIIKSSPESLDAGRTCALVLAALWMPFIGEVLQCARTDIIHTWCQSITRHTRSSGVTTGRPTLLQPETARPMATTKSVRATELHLRPCRAFTLRTCVCCLDCWSQHRSNASVAFKLNVHQGTLTLNSHAVTC